MRGEVFECLGYFWRRYFWRRRYFGGRKWKNREGWKIWWKEKEGKKKEKGKENEKRRYSLGRKSKNNDSGGFSGFGCGCGKLSEKNTEIVPKSSISERPAKILKNQEYYFKNHDKICF